MRVMGVDFGSKRIGLAVMQLPHSIPTARLPLKPTGTLRKDAENLVNLALKEYVDRIVLGLPLMDGVETKMSGICRRLATEIEGLGMPVDLVDEAFTSAEAEGDLRDIGYTAAQRKDLIDSAAAERILSRYAALQAESHERN